MREAVKSAAVRYESAAAELRVAKAAVYGKGGPEDVMLQCVRVLAKAAADLAKNGSVHVVSRSDLAQIRGIYGFDGQRDQWPADKIIAFVDALETWPGFDRAEYAAARGESLPALEAVRTLGPAFTAANRGAERAKEALVRLWREEERIRLQRSAATPLFWTYHGLLNHLILHGRHLAIVSLLEASA